MANYPKYRWLFITLTVENCDIQELRATLGKINKAFTRLTNLKDWCAKGWIKSVEVTRGKDGMSAHPHLHILALLPPSYFSHGYVPHATWVALWQKCLRVDYQPAVHLSAIAKDSDPKIIIPRIIRYQVKESDLTADSEWFLELTRQLHKTRAISVGGVLRQYMRELEDNYQNLADESQKMDESDEGSLSFRWERKSNMYKIEG